MTKKAEVAHALYNLRATVTYLNNLLAKADSNCPAYEVASEMLTDCETRLEMLVLRIAHGEI